MLELQVLDGEEFVTLQFEHSLLSLSKWESKHTKAFLSRSGISPSEQVDYYRCMLLNPDISSEIVYRLDLEQQESLWNYVNTPQTASSVPRDESQTGTPELQTSELIYTWLVLLEIPFHPVETWHLSRATMLVEMVTFKKTPPDKKKKSKMDTLADIMATNAKNKQTLNTRG